jgi:hypothetical protein
MNELHDRINRVINTRALEACLGKNGIDLIEFQISWHKLSRGAFSNLPPAYQESILAGEAELQGTGEIDLASTASPVCA